MNSPRKSQILGERIFTLAGLLTPAECAAWIELAEKIGFAAAPITTHRGFRMAPEIRNNTRVMFDDPARSSALWQRIEPHLESEGECRPVGLNERLRVYRYTPNQYFRWHSDGAFVRNSQEYSLLTLMVYLNGDFEGGATEFDSRSGDIRVVPACGMALLFEHPLRHQGAPVVRGTKYVLRSDVMYRRTADDHAGIGPHE